jgi:hypothetical protein
VCLYLSTRLLSSWFLAISRFIYLLYSKHPGGFWDTLAVMLVEDYLWREIIALFAWRYCRLHAIFGLLQTFHWKKKLFYVNYLLLVDCIDQSLYLNASSSVQKKCPRWFCLVTWNLYFTIWMKSIRCLGSTL